MDDKLKKRLGQILTPEVTKVETSSNDKEVLMFESLPTIHNSCNDYIIIIEDRLLLKKEKPESLPSGSKIYWLPSPLRIGLTGEIGVRFLDYFQVNNDSQLKRLNKRFNDCNEKFPEQSISLENRKIYFFACLTGKYSFSLKNRDLISESDLAEPSEKNQFVIFSSSSSQALRCYYQWVLYPLFLTIIPEKLRKKFWKDPSNIAKLIYQCKDPKEYLPLERLKTMKNITEYQVNEKTKFCTKTYAKNTLDFISEVILYVVNENSFDLSDILEPKSKAEKIMKLRQEIENFEPDEVTFESLDKLIVKIKEYEAISKKNLRVAIKPEDRKKLFPDKCFVCNTDVNIHNGTAGHIESASHNGSSELDNLVPLCSSCNSKMGNINLYEYLYSSGNEQLMLKVPATHFLLFRRYDKEKGFLIESLSFINFQKKDCIDILNNGHLPIRIRFKVIDILFQLLKIILSRAANKP